MHKHFKNQGFGMLQSSVRTLMRTCADITFLCLPVNPFHRIKLSATIIALTQRYPRPPIPLTQPHLPRQSPRTSTHNPSQSRRPRIPRLRRYQKRSPWLQSRRSRKFHRSLSRTRKRRKTAAMEMGGKKTNPMCTILWQLRRNFQM